MYENIVLTITTSSQWKKTLTHLEKAEWHWASGHNPTSIFYNICDDGGFKYANLYLDPKSKTVTKLFNAYASRTKDYIIMVK